jgi:ribonuclease-3
LLALSLRHASAGPGAANNERLEFLGDAVLDLVLSARLYREFPEWREGPLTEVRSRMVNRAALASVGRAVGLEAFVEVVPGLREGGGVPDSVVGGCLEAVVAAVFLDGGMGAVTAVVERLFEEVVRKAVRGEYDRNYKARLQEFVQSTYGMLPGFRVVGCEGPEHGKTFHVVSQIGDRDVGHGKGRSKKEAEQEAARDALAGLSTRPSA